MIGAAPTYSAGKYFSDDSGGEQHVDFSSERLPFSVAGIARWKWEKKAFQDAEIAKPAVQCPFSGVCDTLKMPRSAPASYHLDLYRYWLGKRGGRSMPSRSDIEPGEIPALLPYLGIIEKADGDLRYRLMGTSMVEQLGFDATGAGVGSYVPAGKALRRTVELVCTAACPVFNTGKYEFEPGIAHYSSVLLLPLSEDGTAVNMVIFLRIVRFHSYGWASRGWLRNAPVKIGEPILIKDAAHLEKVIADWESACSAPANHGGEGC